jgi:hypothetical protein
MQESSPPLRQFGRRLRGLPRETREGWPLPTVETEVNGDAKSTNERGSFLVDSLGLLCRYKRFLFPVENIFFPHRTLF